MTGPITFRYFVSGDEPETVETGTGGLFRLGLGEPLALAEVLRPNGEWVLSDRIARHELLGSDDTFTETTPDRAREIVLAWLARGRITVRPRTLPGDPDDGFGRRWSRRRERCCGLRPRPPRNRSRRSGPRYHHRHRPDRVRDLPVPIGAVSTDRPNWQVLVSRLTGVGNRLTGVPNCASSGAESSDNRSPIGLSGAVRTAITWRWTGSWVSAGGWLQGQVSLPGLDRYQHG